MKLVKNLVLLLSAICVARVLVTAIGLSLSVVPIIFELPSGEAARKVTYEALVGYFFVVSLLLAITSVSLFNQATGKKPLQLNTLLVAISLTLCGAHLTLAAIGDPGFLLVEFAQSFIWVPLLTGFATLSSFFIARASQSA